MSANIPFRADQIDTDILAALQRTGRQSIAELARAVNMSHSATAERVRRLEETGVISGYAAQVDPARLGYSILAFVRLRYPHGATAALHKIVDGLHEIIEMHHVTGDDCYIMKIVATDMKHLEQINGKLGSLGGVTTSVVYSSALPQRPLLPPNS